MQNNIHERPFPNVAAHTDQGGQVNNNQFANLKLLYTQYWDDLCQFLHLRFGSGPPDPEDIAQSTFLKYAGLAEPERIDHPKAYLFRTATHLLIDYHRSPKNQNDKEDNKEEGVEHNKCDLACPETILMSKQALAKVEKTLMSLSHRDRAFVLMNRLEGMSYTEIARKAGMSRSGVQKIITQAVEKCGIALGHK